MFNNSATFTFRERAVFMNKYRNREMNMSHLTYICLIPQQINAEFCAIVHRY